MPDRITIVCECGINHGGDLRTALAMVDAAKEAGADIAKFQTYVPDLVLRRSDPDYDTLARHALPLEGFTHIAARCEEVGIEFMSTPGDVESLRFLVDECGVRRIKIGSDDLTNEALVATAYATRLPVILSTGMATLAEVRDALDPFIARVGDEVTLLHCVSLYPCPLERCNLGRMRQLRRFYRPVGYSDHSEGIVAPVYAAAAGAVMIEKHFALTDGVIDEAVSVLPVEFALMVKTIREVEAILGEGGDGADAVNRARFRKGADGLRGLAA